MRAVVMGVQNGKAAVFEKDGGMRYIKDMGYVRGQLIELPDEDRAVVIPFAKGRTVTAGRRALRYGIGIAAAISIVIAGGGITAYASTASTVTVGTYPSMEYRVNYFDRVIGFNMPEGDENAGREDIERKIRGKRIEDAIEISLNEMNADVILNSEMLDEPVRVEGRMPKHAEDLRQRAQDEINSAIDRQMIIQRPADQPEYEIPEKDACDDTPMENKSGYNNSQSSTPDNTDNISRNDSQDISGGSNKPSGSDDRMDQKPKEDTQSGGNEPASSGGSQNPAKDDMNNNPKDKPADSSQGKPQDAPQGNQQNNPQNTPQGNPQNNSQNDPQDNPQNTPQGDPQNNPQQQPQGNPQNNPQEPPQGDPQNNPQEPPQGAPQNNPQEPPQGDPQYSPQELPQGDPQYNPQELPQGNPQYNPQQPPRDDLNSNPQPPTQGYPQ